MVNRRGAIFNRTVFRYAEISDVERAADDLLACGQAKTLRAEDYASFVACLRKDILVGGAKAAGRTDIRVSWSKARLVDYFLTHVPFEVAAEFAGLPNSLRWTTCVRSNSCCTCTSARPRTT